MNRKQRRAAAKQGTKIDEFRRLSRRLVKAGPFESFDPSRRLLGVNIRPMTVDDMAPGYAYEPDSIMFEIAMPATPDQDGALWQMPVHVPAELREPTIDNALAVYALLYSTDPQARAIIDDLSARARPIRESPSGFNGPREYYGRRWLPPLDPTPPDASAPTSTAKN
ncbi:hypothetical protein [uncultured Aureimonas sp.]|uniref:hypothetical protein n=1 Tax=uncultured Aureimonas sp. TaxID=1604662 RepID=UPI0025E525EC|nr:hypothetical protein [uncultured Aureimonas sp.]